MGFLNFLKGVGAEVIPGGKTYGSYNPPKKKLQPGDPGYVAPVSAPHSPAQPTIAQPQIHTQSPQNLFAGLNNNLTLPGAPKTNLTVSHNNDLSTILPPQPGTVVKPTTAPQSQKTTKNGEIGTMVQSRVVPGKQVFVPDAPAPADHSILGHIKSGLKTAAETAIGTVANVPEVGLAAARAGSGIVQGITQLPHIVTAAAATGTHQLQKHVNNAVTRQINRGFQDINTGTKNVTSVINKPLDFVNRNLDNAAQGYENHVPGAAGGYEAYHATQVPLNILAGLLTLGGSSAAEGAGVAGEAGQSGRVATIVNKFQQLLNKPLTSNTDNIVSKSAQVVGNKATPVVQALNRPISSARSGVTQLIGRNPGVVNVGRETADAGNVTNGVEDLTRPPTQIPVTQPTPIDITAPPTEPASIPVRNTTPQGQPIVEIGGDTPGQVRIPTAADAAESRAASRFQGQDFGHPDDRIEGITPTNTGNTGVFTRAEIQAERAALDDSLAAGEINKTAHKAANKELDNLTAVDDAPKGQKIQVKPVDSIPIQNQSNVPTGLPETPGKVRVTDQSAPNNTASEAVAANPVALPKDVQEVLDNPKQFNKRQVAAARNQRKLARQMAKAQEDTSAAVDRIDAASPAHTSDEGFMQTGEFSKGKNGVVQKVHRETELAQGIHETSQLSPGEVVKTARTNQAENGGFSRRDIRNIHALLETKRIAKGTPEYNEVKAILAEDGTQTAQALALRGGVKWRRTASSDQLVSQFESKIYRLVDDPTKVDSTMFNDVEAATTKFTDARDAATAANNRFTEAPTRANAKAYHAAQDAADAADKDAKMTEFKVAQQVLKGNKDAKQVRELQKMAQDSDLYQMDAVDASMLSGTGTFARNFVNSAVGGAEEGLFGGIASRIANKLTGENVGGGFGRGTFRGFIKGASNVVDASKARAGNAGRNVLEHAKNWATTGNQLGDSIIDSQVAHNVLDHYTQVLKNEGYKGRELTDRASVMARQDPDDVGRVYAGYARASAGLGGSSISKGGKVETVIKNGISDFLSGGNPNKVSEVAAKLITRMTVGFPSAVGRTIVEGGKRATLGAPTALRLFTKEARNDPAVRAQLIKESIKQFGSGATTGAIFYKLGQEGLVTGSYPTDPEERAQWQRDGITENSIKIGGNYYQLPSYLGSAALPALFAATVGRNNGDVTKSASEVAKGLPAILPTDQASNVLDWINGRTDTGKFLSQTGASAVRALEPGGALLNQIAKSFDPTQNDTNSGTTLENFMDKVMSGIPGVNNAAGIPDKTDDAGNVLHNPSALPLAFGASSTGQGKGIARTGDLNDQTNSTIKTMSDAGALGDPNLKGILDDKSKKIYDQVTSGKQVKPGDIKKLQEALVKGVSSTGEDTAYLEREQYDTNLAALKLKRNLMSEDKTVKPSDIAKVDTAIKRGQVYKDNEIPYDLVQAYESTSLTDWRDMGDSNNDNYDPDAYQRLYDIDSLLAKAGGSYKKGDPTKNKYSAKQAGSGRGGSRSYSSDFGTLKAGVGAPTVQNYETLDRASGSVPMIQVVRPNIVHKIGSSG